MVRTMISDKITMEPSMTAARVMNWTSRFFRWLISWAITPWSSSRFSRWSSPVVTQIALLAGWLPTANAFGAGSSIRWRRGTNDRPDASCISSTILNNWGLSSRLSSLANAPCSSSDSAPPKYTASWIPQIISARPMPKTTPSGQTMAPPASAPSRISPATMPIISTADRRRLARICSHIG